jgi:hypothetical protein
MRGALRSNPRSRARIAASMRAWFPFVMLSLPAAGAVPPTFVVNNPADAHDLVPGDGKCEAAPNACTLRAAVEEANTTSGATILIPAGMFTLSLGELELKSPMTIAGAGMTATVISGNNASRVFNLHFGTAISDLTIRDGNPGNQSGGGILAGGPLTMDRCLVTSCTASSGGGIEGFLAVDVRRSAITNCQATGGYGGGFFGSGGTFTSCTFYMNFASSRGGGLYLVDPTDLVNSTVTMNTAAGEGGGIYVDIQNYYVNLYNCTVVRNLGGTYGGGVAAGESGVSSLTFVNTIIAYNHRTASHVMYADDCSGYITSAGTSILQVADVSHCTLIGTVSTADPLLGPLQDNGGPTQTQALLDGSPAINAGNSLGCTDQNLAVLGTDQRGVHRPIGAACDMGAYERAPCGDVNGDGSVDVSDIFFLINSLFAGGALPPGLANVNGDSTIDVSDVFYLINALFAGGPAPSCPGT